MPTLICNQPDSFDLDYWYFRYPNRHGLVMAESKPETLHILLADVNPKLCKEKNNKKYHYFHLPTQPALKTCICGKFHANFTSEFYKISPPPQQHQPAQNPAMEISPIISTKRFNKITDELPSSPASKITPKILFPNFSPQPNPNPKITPHSHHTHYCTFCKINDIPCVISNDDQHLPNTENNFIFKGRLFHNTCKPQILYIKCKPLPQTKPLTPSQRAVLLVYIFKYSSKAFKKNFFKNVLTLFKPSIQQQQPLQNSPPHQEKLQENTNTDQQPNPENKQHFTRDTSKDLDWFKQYPITDEMKPNTKLNTQLAQDLFNFIKPFLRNFTPGQPIPSTNENNNSNPNYKPPKQSFNYLLKIMTEKRPEFLINFIKKFNPELDSSFTLPFTAIQTTLKNLLTKFTQVFFTKLNYAHILRSHYSIPPYTIANRSKVAINLARLHLFLHNRYQTIHYSNFIKDLDIKPIRLTLKYNILVDEPTKPLFDIYNDRRFNVFVTLNLPKQRFLETFRTPSLKAYLDFFKDWYEKFFEVYEKQFEKIDKTKVFNFIKYDIATKLSEECKAFLPSNFTLSEVSSFQERRENASKAALFHLHTCKNKTCNILSIDKDHNLKELYSFFLKKSFDQFPAPEPSLSKETKNFPELDFTIFLPDQKLHATFTKPFPLPSFQELAVKADQDYIKLNQNTTSSPQRITFYLYTYLKQYFHQAAKNDKIADLSLDDALSKFITTTSDPHTLARIIAYYDLAFKISTPELRKKYDQSYFPQAEQFIIKHFKLNIPSQLDDSLFFKNQVTIPPVSNSLFA